MQAWSSQRQTPTFRMSLEESLEKHLEVLEAQQAIDDKRGKRRSSRLETQIYITDFFLEAEREPTSITQKYHLLSPKWFPYFHTPQGQEWLQKYDMILIEQLKFTWEMERPNESRKKKYWSHLCKEFSSSSQNPGRVGLWYNHTRINKLLQKPQHTDFNNSIFVPDMFEWESHEHFIEEYEDDYPDIVRGLFTNTNTGLLLSKDVWYRVFKQVHKKAVCK